MALSAVFKVLLIVLLSVVLTYSIFVGAWIYSLQQKPNNTSVTTTSTNTTTPYSGVKCDLNQNTNMKNTHSYNHTKNNNDTSEILTTDNEKRLNVSDTTILLPDTNRTDINIDNIHILPFGDTNITNSLDTTNNEQGIKALESNTKKPSGSFEKSDFERILPFLFVVERYDGKYLCYRIQSSPPASPTSKNCVMINNKISK
ncbi:type-2 histone deacetylase 2-like [Microplitis mediator]|uniref:type-2 histone deacetylase 2-like n=1 Tax=Microplitis mediator TaxID=375433 RepID=UPI002552D0DA|nr:type-2 histone deacetylase 2-like [Microplitis mediator]